MINFYDLDNCIYGSDQKDIEKFVKNPLIHGSSPTTIKSRGARGSYSEPRGSEEFKSSISGAIATNVSSDSPFHAFDVDLEFLLTADIEAVGKASKIVTFLDKNFNVFEEQRSEQILIEKEKTLTSFLAAKARKWISQYKKYVSMRLNL